MDSNTDYHEKWQRKAKLVQTCDAKVREFKFKVKSKSSEGVEYDIEGVFNDGHIKCSCPGYKFRGTCGHLEVKETRCGWDASSSAEAQSIEQKEKGICPRCGSPTERVLRSDL